MQLNPGITKLTADGQVGPANKSIRIHWVHLVSGATASTTTFKLGTSTSGASYIQVDGVANQGVTINFAGGVPFDGNSGGCFMDTDANISYCLIGYSLEVL